MTCLILLFGAFYTLAIVAVMAAWPGVTPGAALALALPGAVLAAWYVIANGAENRRGEAAANEQGRNLGKMRSIEIAAADDYGAGLITYAEYLARVKEAARYCPKGYRSMYGDCMADAATEPPGLREGARYERAHQPKREQKRERVRVKA